MKGNPILLTLGNTPTPVPRFTRMKMRVLESPTRYFPSDTLTMEN